MLGIMQGRLSPKFQNRFQAHPIGNWKNEFFIANELDLRCIEFIFDYNDWELNPLMSQKGIEEIKSITHNSNVKVLSVCADYFMEQPIFDLKYRQKNFDILTKLIHNCELLGVKDIIIPFVDNSSLLNNYHKINETINFLKEILTIKSYSVNLTLETDLPPKKFTDLIEKINHDRIKINYDIGNSASLGYNFYKELQTYSNFITNIHIKDRILGGGSVKLGQGSAKFVDFFKELKKFNFNGIFILQAFRENDGINSLKPQLNFIKEIMSKAYYNY